MYSHWKLEGSSEHLYLQIADIIIKNQNKKAFHIERLNLL